MKIKRTNVKPSPVNLRVNIPEMLAAVIITAMIVAITGFKSISRVFNTQVFILLESNRKEISV